MAKQTFSREIKKHKIQQQTFVDLFVQLLFSIWGVCPTRRIMFHETEANHANLCVVVDCFRGEIHQSREARPPERPQREARLGQIRSPTMPRKISMSVANPFSHPSLPPRSHEHKPGDDLAQKFDRCIPAAAGRAGLWGGTSPPK